MSCLLHGCHLNVDLAIILWNNFNCTHTRCVQMCKHITGAQKTQLQNYSCVHVVCHKNLDPTYNTWARAWTTFCIYEKYNILSYDNDDDDDESSNWPMPPKNEMSEMVSCCLSHTQMGWTTCIRLQCSAWGHIQTCYHPII